MDTREPGAGGETQVGSVPPPADGAAGAQAGAAQQQQQQQQQQGRPAGMQRHAARQLPARCPVCSGMLRARRLSCADCDTELRGTFELSEFARLSPDKLAFLRLFLECRGNLKLVERELRVSYPTVRARLDSLLESLELASGGILPQVDREAVLEALERGELTIEEAERRLRGED